MSGVRVDDCVIGSNNRTVSGYEVVCQVSTEIGVVDCAGVDQRSSYPRLRRLSFPVGHGNNEFKVTRRFGRIFYV